MLNNRAYFKKLDKAQTAAGLGIQIIEEDLEAAATEYAGENSPIAAPIARLRVLSTTPCPVGAIPTSAAAQTIVDYEVTTSDGKIEKFKSIVPTDAVPKEGYATGTIRVFSTDTRSKIRVKAIVGATVQFQALDVVSIPADTVLQDKNTNKTYKTFGITNGGPGFIVALIVEVDTTDIQPVTHGTTLSWVTPPDDVSVEGVVLSTAIETVGVGEELTDADGNIYQTTTTENVGGLDDALSGDDTEEVEIVRDTTAFPVGTIVGGDLVAEDTVLTFTTPIAKLDAEAIVSYAVALTVPIGSKFTRTVAGVIYSYTTTEVGTIGDARYTDIAFTADLLGMASRLVYGDDLTLTSPPSGVPASVEVNTASDPTSFPLDMGAVVLGDKLDLFSHIQKMQDGRYRADIFNAPRGS